MPQSDLSTKVQGLNDRYRHHSAISVLDRALRDPDIGQLALVSSFGAESVVLLHMVSVTRRETPVVFIDTEMLFTETLVYQQELAERLALADLRIIRAAPDMLAARDPDDRLHQRDVDACCALRKTEPLQRVLEGFDGWITGRKRYQSGTRATLEFFEVEEGTDRIKVNPLAHWDRADLQTYIEENRLPRHPLVARGYPSIGCMPCTTPVRPDEDQRSGRWRDQDKTECGIHLVNGRMVPRGVSA